MPTINRSAIIVKPKQPFIDWLKVQGSDSFVIQGAIDGELFLIDQDSTDEDEDYDPMTVVQSNYENIFSEILFGWHTDESTWPKDRTWKMFQDWFSVQVYEIVFDLGSGKIIQED